MGNAKLIEHPNQSYFCLNVEPGAGYGSPFDFTQGKILLLYLVVFRQSHANAEPVEPERDTGVEPVFLPWEGNVGPLN